MQLLSGCFGPTQANSPNITVHEMGPFEGMRTRAFRLLCQLDLVGMAKVFSPWANASTPPGSYPANWKQQRPMRQSHAAAYCVFDGPI